MIQNAKKLLSFIPSFLCSKNFPHTNLVSSERGDFKDHNISILSRDSPGICDVIRLFLEIFEIRNIRNTKYFHKSKVTFEMQTLKAVFSASVLKVGLKWNKVYFKAKGLFFNNTLKAQNWPPAQLCLVLRCYVTNTKLVNSKKPKMEWAST